MSLEPDDEFHAPNPDAKLFAAVLALAVSDLFHSPGAISDRAAKVRAREESRLLLTAESGPWAEHREWLCALAGLDAVALRERILRCLERDPPEPITGRDRSEMTDAGRVKRREAQRRRAARLRATEADTVSPPIAEAAE